MSLDEETRQCIDDLEREISRLTTLRDDLVRRALELAQARHETAEAERDRDQVKGERDAALLALTMPDNGAEA